MESMTKKQKLGVAFGAALIMSGISALGIATTWMNWKTIAWAVALIGSLLVLYRVVTMRNEVTQ